MSDAIECDQCATSYATRSGTFQLMSFRISSVGDKGERRFDLCSGECVKNWVVANITSAKEV